MSPLSENRPSTHEIHVSSGYSRILRSVALSAHRSRGDIDDYVLWKVQSDSGYGHSDLDARRGKVLRSRQYPTPASCVSGLLSGLRGWLVIQPVGVQAIDSAPGADVDQAR